MPAPAAASRILVPSGTNAVLPAGLKVILKYFIYQLLFIASALICLAVRVADKCACFYLYKINFPIAC
jgi:hypothetical protein